MKKYQLWLQRKSYSQHLFNLMKIKNASYSPEKPEHTPPPQLRSSASGQTTFSRYKQLLENQASSDKLGDISYANTYKQLKNRKLRIMQTFQILNQNMSMARRINGAKSVLNSTLKENSLSVVKSNKRKLFEKKCQLSNEEIRQQNFKKFIKWQNSKTNTLHRYTLTLTILSFTKIIHSCHQYAAAWCEISTEKGFLRSQLVSLDNLQGHKLLFSFDCQLPKDCLFRLYICKGLDSEMIGQFQFCSPQFSQYTTNSYRSDDGQFEICLKMLYSKKRKEKYMFNLK